MVSGQSLAILLGSHSGFGSSYSSRTSIVEGHHTRIWALVSRLLPKAIQG